jgi:hypothetical protein
VKYLPVPATSTPVERMFSEFFLPWADIELTQFQKYCQFFSEVIRFCYDLISLKVILKDNRNDILTVSKDVRKYV